MCFDVLSARTSSFESDFDKVSNDNQITLSHATSFHGPNPCGSCLKRSSIHRRTVEDIIPDKVNAYELLNCIVEQLTQW